MTNDARIYHLPFVTCLVGVSLRPPGQLATWPRSTFVAMVKFEKSTVKSRLVHGSITSTFSSLCRCFFRLLLGFLFLPFSLALLLLPPLLPPLLHAFLHSSGSWVFSKG